MKKTLLLTLFVGCFSFAFAKQGNVNALVWRIINPKSQDTSYIMGTLHSEHISITNHISGFDEAWKHSKTIVFESNLFNIGKSPSASRQISEWHDKDIYLRVLGKEKYDTLKESLSDFDFSINPIDFKNMLEYNLYMTIYSGYIFNKEKRINVYNPSFDFGKKDSTYNNMTLGNYSEIFLDFGLQKRCLSENKRIAFLNSKDEDAKLIANEQADCDSCALQKAVNDIYDLITNTNEYFRTAWSLDSIYYNHELWRIKNKETPIKVHAMNRRWMASIRELLKNGETLIVVGARHLVHCGKEKGLLHRIERMGYKIEPIEYKPHK